MCKNNVDPVFQRAVFLGERKVGVLSNDYNVPLFRILFYTH